jgi:hypothetical protein
MFILTDNDSSAKATILTHQREDEEEKEPKLI